MYLDDEELSKSLGKSPEKKLSISGAIMLFIFGIGASVLQGYVVTKLWSWFIVPEFKCNPISILESLGLTVTIMFFTMKLPSNKDLNDQMKFKSEPKHYWYDLLLRVFCCLIALLIGKIYISLM